MVKLDLIKQVYLIGIGGIGMSGLARYFHHQGCFVSGYDRTETELTKQLAEEGIQVNFEDELAFIPDRFKQESAETLVIYTPAIPTDSLILSFFQAAGHPLYKRAEVLGLISKDKYTIAVAGTHGKTTTASLVAHILTDSGFPCSAFLGGIASNYETNMLVSDSRLLVVEADEYDRSFLTLHPDIAIVTSMDADHLDIYDNPENIKESFSLFIKQVDQKGLRIIRKGVDLPSDISYAQGELAEVYSLESRIEDGDFYFDYHQGNFSLKNLHLGIPGNHNVENALAAIAAVRALGVLPEQIKQALSNFKGVKRRFEYIIKDSKHIYIDDYAHHPAELKALFTAVKSLYPTKKFSAIFQPHLYSRTRDFAEDFAEVLSMPDELILMPIYPAREIAIPGVTSEWLLEKVKSSNKKLMNHEEVLDYVDAQQPELLVTLGAGNIDRLVKKIKEVMGHA